MEKDDGVLYEPDPEMSCISAHFLLARAQSCGHIQWQGGLDI